MESFKVFSNEIDGRIEPHFYRPEFTELENRLKKLNHRRLGAVINLSKETWNRKDFYETQFPYIEISEIDITSGEITNVNYYDIKDAPSRARMIVRENDIIVSTTRPHRGAISLIDKSSDGFIASTGFAILRKIKIDNISKEYLLYVLRTSICLKQMLQRSSGGNYPAITSEELKKVIVPIPTKDLQKKIVKVMQDAHKQKTQKEQEAKELLDSVDRYILKEFGLKLPEVTNKLSYTIFASEIEGRLDPYYNSPKFKVLANPAPNKPFVSLVEFRHIISLITKGETPLWRGDSYLSEGIPFLKAQNIGPEGIKGKLAFISEEVHDRMKRSQLLGGELLYTMAGTIGIATILPEDFGSANINQAICKIVVNEEVDKEYIWVVLNSKYSRMQAQRFLTTSAQPNINFEQIKSIKIPLPPVDIQHKIAEHVKERIQKAKRLKEKARTIIIEAKSNIEHTILGEKDES